MIIVELSIGAHHIEAAPVGNSHRVGVQGEIMPKGQNSKVRKLVENVDNYEEYELEDVLRHIHSIITFWGLDNKWPGNFIKDLIEVCIDKSVNVSRGNINDK